jgi:methylglyoxal synthase
VARIALIAHDEKKPDMIDLAESYEETLATCDLVTTGTTGKRIMEGTDLNVERKESGPLGGDAQIAAEITDQRVDAIVFLRDPLRAQPHEPDISALLRLSDVHDIPLTTTRSGAEYLLDGIGREIEDESSG